jgi:hypothetical protein
MAGSNAFFLTKPKNIIEQCDEAHARKMSATAHGGFNIQQNPTGNKTVLKSRGGAISAYGTSASVGRERLMTGE